MSAKATELAHNFFLIGAIVTWTAVILQLYLIIENRVESVAETLVRFFTFFTILVNILAALCFTSLVQTKGVDKKKFFSRVSVVTAVAVYISIVFLVYQFVLRATWSPQGLDKVADEMLHTLNPAFFVLCWFRFIPKYTLLWKNIFLWMIFPLCYLALILWRGTLSGYYPYPFVNVATLGYNKVLLNCGMVLVIFLVFSIIFIGVGKISSKPSVAAG
jgi:hypothetical protein